LVTPGWPDSHRSELIAILVRAFIGEGHDVTSMKLGVTVGQNG